MPALPIPTVESDDPTFFFVSGNGNGSDAHCSVHQYGGVMAVSSCGGSSDSGDGGSSSGNVELVATPITTCSAAAPSSFEKSSTSSSKTKSSERRRGRGSPTSPADVDFGAGAASTAATCASHDDEDGTVVSRTVSLFDEDEDDNDDERGDNGERHEDDKQKNEKDERHQQHQHHLLPTACSFLDSEEEDQDGSVVGLVTDAAPGRDEQQQQQQSRRRTRFESILKRVTCGTTTNAADTSTSTSARLLSKCTKCKCVSFSEPMVTQTEIRPNIHQTREERTVHFYSLEDFKRFRREAALMGGGSCGGGLGGDVDDEEEDGGDGCCERQHMVMLRLCRDICIVFQTTDAVDEYG